MTDEPPAPPKTQYPTRASLRGRAPLPASAKSAASTKSTASTASAAAPATRPTPVVPGPAPATAPRGLAIPPRTDSIDSAPPATAPAGLPISTPGSSPAAPASSPPAEPKPHPGRSIPRAAAIVVALIGVALLIGGGLQGTVFKPPATTSASLSKAPTQPIVVSRTGMIGLAGPRLKVTAESGSSATVFLGIGRAHDVEAYLGKVARVSLTGEDGAGALTSTVLGSEPSLPDPGSADVWVVSVRGKGTATLNWPDVGGEWVLVAAGDGTAPAPSDLTFTWSGAKAPASGSALIAIGAVFTVCGLVLLIMLISRAKLESAGVAT